MPVLNNDNVFSSEGMQAGKLPVGGNSVFHGLIHDQAGNITFAQWNGTSMTLPTLTGWAVGAWLHDLTNKKAYINQGTTTVASFIQLADLGTGTMAFTGSISVPTGKTISTADADGFRSNSVIVPDRFYHAHTVGIATDCVDKWIFIAPRACTLTLAKWVHAVASTSGTFAMRKGTVGGTALPGDSAGATLIELLDSGGLTFSTAGSASTNVTPTLSAVAGAVTFAAGDRLGLKTGGTQTNLVGGVLQLTFKAV